MLTGIQKRFSLQLPLRGDVVVADTKPFVSPLVDIADRGAPTGVILVGGELVRLVQIEQAEATELENSSYELTLGDWRPFGGSAGGSPARGLQTVSHQERYRARAEAQRDQLYEAAATQTAKRRRCARWWLSTSSTASILCSDIGHIWSLRYPWHNPLHLHRRQPGGPSGVAALDEADAAGTLKLHSDDGAEAPLVVIASERISGEAGWEEIHPGELVHVGPDLEVDRETIVSGPPAHPMVLARMSRKHSPMTEPAEPSSTDAFGLCPADVCEHVRQGAGVSAHYAMAHLSPANAGATAADGTTAAEQYLPS